MTSPTSSRTRIVSLPVSCKLRFFAILALLSIFSGVAAYAASTTTTLAISSTSVPYKTPITLTATVTSGGSPVTAGLVMFCDASATYCENNSALLAKVQLTASSATAVVKIGSGALGTHSYKAVYRANATYASSTSNTVSYAVQGTYGSSTALASSGAVGNYTLASTVTGVGAITSPGPSGSVQFLDASVGNNILGTQNLGSPVLTNNFTRAPNSPFAIGDGLTTTRSVVVASSYLNGDNNLDVVTGDADQVITVLLGNGDGTFQPKVNYPGCPSLSSSPNIAVKILLADFNRDGNIDVALGCSDGVNGGVALLLGNGNGSFQSPQWQSTGDLAGLTIGDFNNDGILDIALTDKTLKDVKIMLGNGNGTFQSPVTVVSPPRFTGDIVAADFNGDGKDDLAYVIKTSAPASNLSDLYIALGKGDGTFRSPTLLASQVGEFLTTGDTNGDNIPDIISSTVMLDAGQPAPHTSNSMFVLIGNGNGTFQSPVSYVSDIPSDPHLADVNGDGKADIIAGGSYGALVYLGNGDGTFQAYNEPVIGGFNLTYAVNAGDYNNDGNADLIGTDAQNPRAAVALSEVRQAADSVALTGVAVFPLGSGIHNVAASYSGDTIYLSSLSSTVPLLAAPTPTTLALTVSPASGAVAGQPVTLTATLSPYTVGPPTTTTDGQSVVFYSGATQIGTGTLGSGIATLTTTSLTPGNVSLKAVYPGDTNYNTSTSSTVSITISSVSLATNPNPSNYRQVVTLTATVPSGATGTVTFKDGGTVLGTAAISGTTASITVSTFSVGSHNLTAAYGGDGTYSAATSQTVTQVVNKVAPVMSVTTSGQSTYLSTVTITATVPSDATGSVIFTSGATNLGTATISGGSASVTTTVLPVGNNTITASYAGDTSYTSGSATTTRAVTKLSPSSVLTSSANPSVFGSAVTFTDTLPSTVTGTVTFTSDSTTLGTATVTNGIATLTTSLLPTGSSTITATYSGDGNNNASVATLPQVVGKATPSVALASSLNPSTVGQAVTFTATLSNNATGTVTFTNGATVLGTGTLAGGIATLTTSALPVGSATITASYGGDTNNNTASQTLNQVVNKADPAMSVTTSGPSVYGAAVTVTATLPNSVTGTVTFTNGATALGTATIASGVATISTSILPVGSNTITANYSGDASNNTATGSVVQTVSKASPTSTLTSSVNPSVFGTSVTFTDTLPSSVTGTVTFSDGTSVLGTATVNSGVATLTTSSLPVGSDTITAVYNGDSNNNTSSASLTQTVSKNSPTLTLTTSGPSTFGSSVTITATLPTNTSGSVVFTYGATNLGTGTIANGVATIATTVLPVGNDTITANYAGDSNNNPASGTTSQAVSKTSPALNLSSSLNPSAFGELVTFTATLPTSTTGTVTFSYGATVLGTATVSNGVATVATSTLPLGSDTVSAVYSGDANYNTATGSLVQTVNHGATTITVTTSGPSVYGNPVTITATVPAGATGTITFTSGGVTLGSGPVSAGGTVVITYSALPVGNDIITANYGGDTTYSAATGSTTQVVSKATPPVAVTTSGPSNYGDPVTITATLPPGTTGTVTFTSGVTALGTATINPATSAASVTTTILPIGTDTITANYSGDTNNNPASGSTTQAVSKATPAISLISSLNPSTFNQPVTFTATVPVTATGTITFFDGAGALGSSAVVGGTAAITISTLTVGSHPITATYSGDPNNNGVTSAPLAQVVQKFTPVLPPPTVSNANPDPNTPVTITEQVPPGVTGSVTFSNGSTVIGTAPIVGGVATITVPSLPIGSNPITASVPATSTYNAATSAPTIVTVGKLTPTVTLTSSINPSAANQAVIFTATVPSAATGSITFMDGAVSLGTANVVGGQASITDSTLSSGTHTITAVYGGDTTYNTATSAPLVQNVGKTTPILPAPVVSNPTQTYGGTETITETVPPGVSGPVTFYNGSTPIGTAPVVNGTATITVSNLPIGSNPITASTPGDANNNPATSPATIVTIIKTTPVLPAPGVSSTNPNPNTPVTITEQVPSGVTGPIIFSNGSTVLGTAPVVNGVATLTVPSLPLGSNPITASVAETATSNAATSPATIVTVGVVTPTVLLTSSANPAALNQAVIFTASVPAGATGTMTFHDGSTVLGTGAISGAGVATLSISTLTIGTHPITANYSGDSSYNPAVSPVLSQVIGKLPTTITLSVGSGTSLINGPVTFTAVVSSTAPTPTGTVTFLEGTTVLGTVALSTNGTVVGFQLSGTAALSISTLSGGSHQITAVYSGDTSFLTSTSAPVAVLIHDFTNKNTGAASAEVFPGDSATYKFTLTPVGTTTFLSNVNLTVSGLPTGTDYTFSPASVNGGAGGTEVTLTLKTSPSLQASNRTPERPGSPGGSSIALGVLGLVGLGAVRRYRRRMPKLLIALLLLAGSLLPVASLTGCAGGYFALKPTTYTVTVTGTEGTIQHSATATLVVQ
ncbi:MAG: Ig-like domain repeat protein [Acidobacteria bacterium]|nr:Ig-like domain repeat protein [Acidobacteriota bacterium]